MRLKGFLVDMLYSFDYTIMTFYNYVYNFICIHVITDFTLSRTDSFFKELCGSVHLVMCDIRILVSV